MATVHRVQVQETLPASGPTLSPPSSREPRLCPGLTLLACVLEEMQPDRAADLILAIERRAPDVGRHLLEAFLAPEDQSADGGDERDA